jgi:hypothetical protein
MSTRDSVRLSEQERRQFATIQAALEAGDPELARILSTRRRALEAVLRAALVPWRALTSWLVAQRAYLCLRRLCLRASWPGPLLVVLGMVVIFSTISSLTWLSLAGAALVAFGLGLWLRAWQRRRARRALLQ